LKRRGLFSTRGGIDLLVVLEKNVTDYISLTEGEEEGVYLREGGGELPRGAIGLPTIKRGESQRSSTRGKGEIEKRKASGILSPERDEGWRVGVLTLRGESPCFPGEESSPLLFL